mmetsp:Transcript_31608/g.44878  ORF Transcript_31608/g.44878 Transcript_31608/m.44878 type:complete len:277 (-) Transcript_31608:465-1295(-)
MNVLYVLGGILGLIILVLGLRFLCHFELRYIGNKQEFDQAKGEVISISDINNLPVGRLVFLTGSMNLGVLDEDADNNTTPSLTDQIFNIQVDNAVQLFRNVEVYQWVEQEIDADSDPDVDLQTLQDRRQRKLRRSGGGFSSSSGSKRFSSSAGTSSYRNHYYSSPGGSYFYYTGWNTGLRPTSHFTNTIDGVENPETALFPLRRYIHPLVLLNEHLPLNEELLLRMDWWTYIFTLSLSDLPENTTASNGAKLYDSMYYFYGDDVTNVFYMNRLADV